MFDPLIQQEPQTLSKEELERYSRHLIMPEFGVAAQRKLKNARVLIIGTGGLGSPTCLYLAAAGVGKLGIIDFDRVDASNLQRQIIHTTPDVGRSKIESAREKIQALNPHVEVVGYEQAFEAQNAKEIVADYDLVIDGTDNFPTRYLTNDVCVLLNKPNIYGSIFRFEGQASVFWAAHGPCYRCLFPTPPPPGLVPSCAEGGVLGILPGIIGVIQATEAIKVLTGIGEPLVGRLQLFDALSMKFRELKLRKDPNCPLCGENPSITELIDYQNFCGAPAADTPAADTPAAEEKQMTPQTLFDKIKADHGFVLLDVREDHEVEICQIDGSTCIPLSSLADRFQELDATSEMVVYCRSGVRSQKAINFLRQQGFENVHNLEGGILAWAKDIDPSMPQY
jgi:molybdopterin/thiamine biosynthesis adenylyltransferase/rhodanese-related sulfurtransferase